VNPNHQHSLAYSARSAEKDGCRKTILGLGPLSLLVCAQSSTQAQASGTALAMLRTPALFLYTSNEKFIDMQSVDGAGCLQPPEHETDALAASQRSDRACHGQLVCLTCRIHGQHNTLVYLPVLAFSTNTTSFIALKGASHQAVHQNGCPKSSRRHAAANTNLGMKTPNTPTDIKTAWLIHLPLIHQAR
jgi:hypothetical protein